MGADDVVKIIPVVSGAGGRRGLGQILLGAALIGVSFLVPGSGVAEVRFWYCRSWQHLEQNLP